MEWASCQILKIASAHAPGIPQTFSPSPQVSDPDMYHGTCVTHVPWCMPGSLTSVSFEIGGGGNVPGIPGACATCNFTYLVRGPCLESTMETLVLDILICWKWPHTNKYYYVNATLKCSVMDEKCDFQCPNVQANSRYTIDCTWMYIFSYFA